MDGTSPSTAPRPRRTTCRSSSHAGSGGRAATVSKPGYPAAGSRDARWRSLLDRLYCSARSSTGCNPVGRGGRDEGAAVSRPHRRVNSRVRSASFRELLEAPREIRPERRVVFYGTRLRVGRASIPDSTQSPQEIRARRDGLSLGGPSRRRLELIEFRQRGCRPNA